MSELQELNLEEVDIDRILSQMEEYKNIYLSKKSQLDILEKQRDEIIDEIDEIDACMHNVAGEKALLEKSSEKARTVAKEIVEQVTTNSLQQIFDDGREVSISLGFKGGQPIADLFVMHGSDDTDPAKEEGGGIADIVSTTTFLALSDSLGNVAPFYLDEPNKYVSREYSVATGNFLSGIVDYTGRQMFMSTHDEHLKTIGDTCYKMTKVDKTTYIENV